MFITIYKGYGYFEYIGENELSRDLKKHMVNIRKLVKYYIKHQTNIQMTTLMEENMFNLKKKFEFLEDGIDFPFYNDNPKLSTREWGLIAVALIIFTVLCFIKGIPKTIHAALYFLVMIIPAIYICKGNYSLFFKKPKLRDIITIVLCLVGYLVYSILVFATLSSLGYQMANNASSALNINLMFYVTMLFQLVGEEFFKIFILLIVMYLVYKSTNNRNLSIYIGIIATLLVFGLAHFAAYDGRILQVLLIQGLGTIFNLYAYMKTKNFIVTYIIHVLIDSFSFMSSALVLLF